MIWKWTIINDEVEELPEFLPRVYPEEYDRRLQNTNTSYSWDKRCSVTYTSTLNRYVKAMCGFTDTSNEVCRDEGRQETLISFDELIGG